jgi:hypothetical protein
MGIEDSSVDENANVAKLSLSFFWWPRFGDAIAFALFLF